MRIKLEKSKTGTYLTIIGCVIMVMITLGFTSSTRSLFPDEIAKYLEVQRSLVTISESLRYVFTAVANVFFGALVVKFGPRKLIFVGFGSLICSMTLFAVAENLILIYIAGALHGIGLAFTTTTMVGYVVEKYCSANKGTVMGAVLASNGIGGAIAIQVVGRIIDPAVTGSYRAAYVTIVVVLTVAAVLVAVMLISGMKPRTELDVTVKEKKAESPAEGMEFSEVLHKWYFWCMIVCLFIMGMVLTGTSAISMMHFKDVGINYSLLTTFSSAGSILLVAAKFSSGFLYDKVGLRITSSFCIAMSVMTTALLALANGNTAGAVIAGCYYVVANLAMPLETVMLPLYAKDLFGDRAYTKTMGIFVSACTAGHALGASLMNLCYDTFGTYVPALTVAGVAMAVMLVTTQFIISAAKRDADAVNNSKSEAEATV